MTVWALQFGRQQNFINASLPVYIFLLAHLYEVVTYIKYMKSCCCQPIIGVSFGIPLDVKLKFYIQVCTCIHKNWMLNFFSKVWILFVFSPSEPKAFGEILLVWWIVRRHNFKRHLWRKLPDWFLPNFICNMWDWGTNILVFLCKSLQNFGCYCKPFLSCLWLIMAKWKKWHLLWHKYRYFDNNFRAPLR